MTRQNVAAIGRRLVWVVMVAVLVAAGLPRSTFAATINPAPTAKISFTFDDGLSSVAAIAQPTLTQNGLTGTAYITTGCVGMTTAPNTCRADTDATYMTWAQIQALQNTYGWEIGAHTVSHSCLASSGGDCQNQVLTAAQVDSELSQSKSDLSAHGINATNFAAPYGDYNNAVLAQVAKYYTSMRGFKEENTNVWPYNEYLMNNLPMQQGITTVPVVQAAIDQAIANKSWLVLTFHTISATPSANPDEYQYGASEFSQIAAYAAVKQSSGLIKSVNMRDGFVSSDVNLLPNGSFASGIASGWTTDKPANVAADATSHGSYPSPVDAVKFTSPASGNAHLFSPKIAVSSQTSYMFKSFLNVQALTTGVVAFYVDEYNAAGNWVSGQYLKQETSPFVENMNFSYKPSSSAVTQAALQVIVGGTGVTAYLDNAQMFPLTVTTPTNLVANGTFDNGISAGWTTDNSTLITPDAGNHGSPENAVHSVALNAGTGANVHLFSPRVAVVPGRTYDISAYLNVTAITSREIGFYVDEYSAAGNWVSGRYVQGVTVPGTSTVSFVYAPQSGAVATASLQTIVVGGSGAHAYFDNVKWYQQ